MTENSRCEECNKSNLALLLLRPSPLAKDIRLAPPGSATVLTDADETAGLLPSCAPTEARYAMRLLRPGYVYVFIPKPPKGTKEWLEYRVTEQGDMVPRGSAWFSQSGAPLTCKRKGHNATGLKIISIPQAHKIDEVWIAYSANLWNSRLREKNKANPRIMQKILLTVGAETNLNAFLPTAANLKAKVLECALPYLAVDKNKEREFPFQSLATSVNELSENLKRAANSHPKTMGREMAVVLRDPVGIATEFNEIRLRRNELARREMERSENLHPLNSSHILMGLKKFTVDEAFKYSAINATPIVTEQTYISMYKNNPEFVDATWDAVEEGPGSKTAYGIPLGRVWTQENRKRFRHAMELHQATRWAGIQSEYSEADRLRWLADFDKKMKATHFDYVAKCEADWWASCTDRSFKDYFEFHFDENDPNSPHEQHSSGITYVREATLALTPGPLTDRLGMSYAQQLTEEVTKPSAVLLRALGGNQASVVAAMSKVFILNTAVAHVHGERNDKLYDFVKEIILGAGETAHPNLIQKALVKYSWLSIALGDVMGAYTLIISQSLGAAVTAVGLRAGVTFFESQLGRTLLGLVETVQLVQRASDLALESVVSGTALKTPMQITKKYPIKVALRLLGERGGFNYSEVRSAASRGKIELVLLTDNIEMKDFGGNIDAAIKQGAGKVQPKMGQSLPLPPQLPQRTITLTDSQFAQLWRSRVKVSARAANAIQEAFTGGHAVFRSLEGRLALGVILINSVGLMASMNKLDSADAAEVRDSWVCLIDSAFSALSGALLVVEVAAKANIAARLGAEAVVHNVGIPALRGLGSALGVIAGIVTAFGQWAKAGDAHDANYTDVRWLYIFSGTAFLASSAVGTLTIAGAIADGLIARGTTSAVISRIAGSFGAEGVACFLGVSATGWGLILMTLGVTFEVSAVIVSPTELQKWVQRSYFGYGKGKEPKFPKGDWNTENAALEKLFPPRPAPIQIKSSNARAG